MRCRFYAKFFKFLRYSSHSYLGIVLQRSIPSFLMSSSIYKVNCEFKTGMVWPSHVRRLAIGVEYEGTGLNGFQKQTSSSNTVQAFLENALSKVANESIALVCAGRTDAGVHATNQVVHFDTTAQRPLKAWVRGVNTHLPDSIRVHWAHCVRPEFHARFSALARTYIYLICADTVRSALHRKQLSWVDRLLDVAAMQQAATRLIGEHDYSSFRASQCQASHARREIHSLSVEASGKLIKIEVSANAFLYHMVRNIAGTLIDIGLGRRTPSWIQELLVAKDRTLASPTAAAAGLYFVGVNYPPEFGLPLLCRRVPLLWPD